MGACYSKGSKHERKSYQNKPSSRKPAGNIHQTISGESYGTNTIPSSSEANRKQTPQCEVIQEEVVDGANVATLQLPSRDSKHLTDMETEGATEFDNSNYSLDSDVLGSSYIDSNDTGISAPMAIIAFNTTNPMPDGTTSCDLVTHDDENPSREGSTKWLPRRRHRSRTSPYERHHDSEKELVYKFTGSVKKKTTMQSSMPTSLDRANLEFSQLRHGFVNREGKLECADKTHVEEEHSELILPNEEGEVTGAVDGVEVIDRVEEDDNGDGEEAGPCEEGSSTPVGEENVADGGELVENGHVEGPLVDDNYNLTCSPPPANTSPTKTFPAHQQNLDQDETPETRRRAYTAPSVRSKPRHPAVVDTIREEGPVKVKDQHLSMTSTSSFGSEDLMLETDIGLDDEDDDVIKDMDSTEKEDPFLVESSSPSPGDLINNNITPDSPPSRLPQRPKSLLKRRAMSVDPASEEFDMTASFERSFRRRLRSIPHRSERPRSLSIPTKSVSTRRGTNTTEDWEDDPSDRPLTLPQTEYRQMVQELSNMKLLLFRFKRMLLTNEGHLPSFGDHPFFGRSESCPEEDAASVMTSSLCSADSTVLESATHGQLVQEILLLHNANAALRGRLSEKEVTIGLLQEQMTKYTCTAESSYTAVPMQSPYINRRAKRALSTSHLTFGKPSPSNS